VLSPPKIRYTRSGEKSLAYATYGIGPLDIVFLSPFLSHVEVMVEPPPLNQVYSRLSALGRLVLFDRRGAGLSDPAGGYDGSSIDAWSNDLESVLAAVGANQVCLFTFDTGAPYALVYAASHPERVRSIALIEPMVPHAGATGGRELGEFTASVVADTWGAAAIIKAVSPALGGDPASASWWGRFERMSMSRGTAQQAMQDFFSLDVRSAVPLVQAPVLLAYSTDLPGLAETRGYSTSSGPWLREHLPKAHTLEVAHSDVHWWWQSELRSEMLDAVSAHFTGRAEPFDVDRFLATMLFTDLVGSTKTAARLGDRRWQQVLDEHDALVMQELKLHRGDLVKSTGDGILAVFDAPVRAIRCAQAIRERLSQLNLAVRVGIHTGEIGRSSNDVSGIAVHLTARVMALAEGDEILVSRTVRELVVGSGITFSDRGEYELRGIPERWQLFVVDG
jgi:class 3 adenylate cyclase